MAIDTANKRRSVLANTLPFLVVLPEDDGSMDQGDRQHVAFLYRGILVGVVAAVRRARMLLLGVE